MKNDKSLELDKIMSEIEDNRNQRGLLEYQRDEILFKIANLQEKHSKLMDRKFYIRRKTELDLKEKLANNSEYKSISSEIKENKHSQELLENQYDEILYSLYSNNEDYFVLKNHQLCLKLDAKE